MHFWGACEYSKQTATEFSKKKKKKKKTATEANEMTNEQAENNLPRAVQSGIVDRQGFVFSNWLCFSLNS
jgi:hypothetical protein